MALGETKGIILFTKDFKEKDKLVKIFTESYGKLMFFVKGAHRKNNPLLPAILPFTEAVYIGNFREEGLSFSIAAKKFNLFETFNKTYLLTHMEHIF